MIPAWLPLISLMTLRKWWVLSIVINFTVMEFLFLIHHLFYARVCQTRARVFQIATLHGTTFCGDFLHTSRLNNQIRISFAARHMLLHPGEETVSPRRSRRLKRYFSLYGVRKKGTIYKTWVKSFVKMC